MDALETTELIESSSDKRKNRTALTISILAMVLAIASLGGSNAAKEATQENILAANAYAFYQAKTIRQTSLKIAATDLELQLAREPAMVATAKELFQKKIDEYKKTIDRYESEPDTKQGKKELLSQAREHEAARDHALRQDPWFDYAEGMLQIAIVLLSVSIVGSIPVLFLVGAALGGLGLLSMLNGFLLIV
ncbi:MAG: DUF4337 domain-containing protein [Comamonadaceae bacterium]|jgi:hypothetical protein|nr:MAG: DUF4337 domain-containing protein [Comamonadaceae bacterium]